MVDNIVSTEPRLLLAGLVPFKRYVRVRFTGRSRVVEFDGRREVFRSGLLPRPSGRLEVRYSRYGLYKRGYPKRRLRGIVEGFLEGLPNTNAAYRFLLRLRKLRKRGLRRTIDRVRSRIAKALGLLTRRYLAKTLASLGAKRRGLFSRLGLLKVRLKSFFSRERVVVMRVRSGYLVIRLRSCRFDLRM